MAKKQITCSLAVSGLCLLSVAGSAISQDRNSEDGGFRATLDLNTQLRASSNADLDTTPDRSTSLNTSLDLGLLSDTRNQSLEFNLGGDLEAETGPGASGDDGFTSPRASLAYSLEAARSRLSLNANFNRNDIDGFTEIFDPTLGATLLVSDSGERTTTGFGAELELGTQGPFGVMFSLSQRSIDYDGTTSTSLFDQETYRLGVDTSFDISPVLDANLDFSASRYEAEDVSMTERDTRSVTFGLTYAASSITTVTFSTGWRRIDSTTNGLSEGGEWSLGVARDLPRGGLSVDLSRSRSFAGARNDLVATWDVDLPAGGLSFAAGITDVPGGDTEPRFSVSYDQELARGSLSASLQRSVTVDDAGDVQGNLRGAIDVNYVLTSASQLGIAVSFTDIEDVTGSGVSERQRASIGATFEQALAQDWTLSVGAEHRFLDDAGSRRRDNAVFVNIGRSFTFRP